MTTHKGKVQTNMASIWRKRNTLKLHGKK